MRELFCNEAFRPDGEDGEDIVTGVRDALSEGGAENEEKIWRGVIDGLNQGLVMTVYKKFRTLGSVPREFAHGFERALRKATAYCLCVRTEDLYTPELMIYEARMLVEEMGSDFDLTSEIQSGYESCIRMGRGDYAEQVKETFPGIIRE